MTVDVSKYALAAYNLPLVAKPVEFCTQRTANGTLVHQSKIIPVTIQWSAFPTFAVTINLNQGTAGVVMDKIVGMYVDNTSNQASLSFICPDTGYRVDCPAGQQRFFPLFTRTNIVNIFNGVFFNSLSSAISDIQILFTNFVYTSFDSEPLNQVITQVELSTLLIGGNKDPLFANNVAGDKHFDTTFDLSNVIASTPFFLTATPLVGFAGLLIVTNMEVAIENCYSATGPLALSMGFTNQASLGTGTTYTFNLNINTDNKFVPYTVISRLSSRFFENEITIANAGVPLTTFFNNVAIPGGKAHFSYDCTWI